MTNLKARIAQLEKVRSSCGPLVIYDNGDLSNGQDLEIAKAEESGRAVIRVSAIDVAL